MNIKRRLFEHLVDTYDRWKRGATRCEVHQMFSGCCDDVDLHLEQLQREGLITLRPDGESIELTPLCPKTGFIKVSGSLADAGGSRGDGQANASIFMDLQAVGINSQGELSAHIVLDDCMIDAGIRRGDIAVLSAAELKRGDIAALIVADQLTLRRCIVIKDVSYFLAENAAQPDLVLATGTPVYGVLQWVVSPKTNFSPDRCQAQRVQVDYSRDGALDYRPSWFDLSEPSRPKHHGRGPIVNVTGARSMPECNSPRRLRRDKTVPVDRWPEDFAGGSVNEKPAARYSVRAQEPAGNKPTRKSAAGRPLTNEAKRTDAAAGGESQSVATNSSSAKSKPRAKPPRGFMRA